MANLPKLLTISGFFTWLKAKVIRITGTDGDIELKEKFEGLGGNMVGLVNSDENGYIVVDENYPAVNQGGVFRFGIGNWKAIFYGTSYGIYPANEDASKLGDSSYPWHEIYIGTGGIYTDSKITFNPYIFAYITPFYGDATDPNSDGGTGSSGTLPTPAENDCIVYVASDGTRAIWQYDGTQWVKLG